MVVKIPSTTPTTLRKALLNVSLHKTIREHKKFVKDCNICSLLSYSAYSLVGFFPVYIEILKQLYSNK